VDLCYLQGRWETISPLEYRVAVLAPPTGNRVLNQIPVGDSRESSREQVVPGDRAPLHRTVSGRGWETISPLWLFMVSVAEPPP